MANAEEWKRETLDERVAISIEVPPGYQRIADQRGDATLNQGFRFENEYGVKIIFIEKHSIERKFDKTYFEKHDYLLFDYPLDQEDTRKKTLKQLGLKSNGKVATLNRGHQGVFYPLEGQGLYGKQMIVVHKGYIIRVMTASNSPLTMSEEKFFERILMSVGV